MHYVKAKGILSAKNGMNLYRGCQHGCIYCDSRSACYQMAHPFEDVEVKENALALLDDALRRKRKPCMIGMGSMTDPYIPLERELEYTKGALEMIERRGFGATLITKSASVLRDTALFEKINDKTKCVVQMTMTTYDEALCRKIEPNVSSTYERFLALKKLREAGIPTVVWLCPILPFINDTEENIRGILDYCAQAGVRGILFFGMGLTLRAGNREYFYERLDRDFPGLKERYILRYGGAYMLESPRSRELTELFYRLCRKAGICSDKDEIFAYLKHFEEKHRQLSLFE